MHACKRTRWSTRRMMRGGSPPWKEREQPSTEDTCTKAHKGETSSGRGKETQRLCTHKKEFFESICLLALQHHCLRRRRVKIEVQIKTRMRTQTRGEIVPGELPQWKRQTGVRIPNVTGRPYSSQRTFHAYHIQPHLVSEPYSGHAIKGWGEVVALPTEASS